MKLKKRILCIALTILSIVTSNFVNVSAVTQNDTALITQYISRMNELNILSNGVKDKNIAVTREMFSKSIVVAAGLEGYANLNSTGSEVSDVSASNTYSKYINTAISKRLMFILVDNDKFSPKKSMTFWEACMVMVRTLGYYSDDLKETWPAFYIDMANKLGITKDISLKANDTLPLWAAAVMFDRMMGTNMGSSDKKYYEQTGLYSELIFLDNSNTTTSLPKKQVRTDKGIYNIASDVTNLQLGYKYRVKIQNDNIIKTYSKLNAINTLIVDDSFNPNSLPKYISYYVNGTAKSFDDIKSSLVKNSTILLAYNDSKTSYEYGIICSPIYSSPVTAKVEKGVLKAGNINLNTNIVNQNGQAIKKEQIKAGNIIYEVKDLFGKARYILVVDNKVEGFITAMSLNSSNNKSIEIDNKRYETSSYADIKKLALLNIEDKVEVLLDYEGKIVEVNKIQYKSGPYIDCVVTDNNLTDKGLAKNQVSTSQGIYYYLDGMNFELGSTYKVVIDGEFIVKAEKVKKSAASFVVEKFSDYTIEYADGNEVKSLILPKLSTYYYEGRKVDYNALKDIIEIKSTVLLVQDEVNKGYEYGIVCKPVYSKPEIADSKIVYEVKDIFGKSKYTLVVNQRIEGNVTGIIYNKITPVAIEIDNRRYDLNIYADADKITALNKSDKVEALLGYDGKVVAVNKIQYKSGPSIECVVTGIDKDTHSVVTNVGTYGYLDDISFEIGSTYKVVIDENMVVKAEKEERVSKKITVERFLDNTIFYKDGDKLSSITLPRLSAYYDGNSKVDYNNLKNIIQLDSTIILTRNSEDTGYSYGVIAAPIYSSPIINGRNIDKYFQEYDFYDVVYTVTDVYGNNAKEVNVSNKVTGKITGILPNKVYPTSVQINGKEYELSKYFDYSKRSYLIVNSNITLILGYDGKILDIM